MPDRKYRLQLRFPQRGGLAHFKRLDQPGQREMQLVVAVALMGNGPGQQGLQCLLYCPCAGIFTGRNALT